jgi:hypothetical protein
MSKIDAVIKLIKKEFDKFEDSQKIKWSTKRKPFMYLKKEVIGYVEALREFFEDE